MRIIERLSEQDKQDIRRVVAHCQAARHTQYKLDAGWLDAADQPYVHILCEEGYACASRFDPSEIEATPVANDSATLRALCAAVRNYAREHDVRRVLCIADRQDAELSQALLDCGAEREFAEMRMELDEHKFASPASGAVRLRPATDADRPDLARLDGDAFADGSGAHIAPEDVAATKMALLDGKTIGKLRVYDSEGTFGIYGFVMDACVRGKGYGRAALGQLLCELTARHPRSIYLEVDPDNTPALHLYTSMGFVPLCTFDYYALAL